MAFFDGTSRDKMVLARKLFMEATGQVREHLNRVREDFDFAAGRQWEADAIETLGKDNRPALTFNLCKQVVGELVGANEDVRKRMHATPVGRDSFTQSQMMDEIWQRVYSDQEVSSVEMETLEKALIGGYADVQIDIEAMEGGRPDWFNIIVEPLTPWEVIWDPNAEKKDYSDAKYVFRTRWVSETDFKKDFPDHADRFKELRKSQSASDHQVMIVNEDQINQDVVLLADPGHFADPQWFNRDEQLIRVVHMEYEEPVQRHYANDTRPGPDGVKPTGWVPISRETFLLLSRTENLEVRQNWEREIKWLEFTGVSILYDDVQPVPIDRFAIRRLTAYWDWRLRFPYGPVSQLKDPQREVNKRYSHELDSMLRQAQPGILMEESAVEDPEAFAQQTRMPGGTAITRKGALSGGQVIERQPPQPNAANVNLGQQAFENFNRVAGIMLDPLIGSRSTNEPVGTALLKHRRSLMAIRPILENFRKFQRDILMSVIELITRALPDDQIVSMLSDPTRWQVEDGIVTDMKSQQQVPMSSIRDPKWNIEAEAHADDTTGQILLLQTMIAVSQAGLAIDPDIITDLLPIPGDQKMQQKIYSEQQMQQAQQQQQEQQQLAMQQQQGQDQRTSDIIQIEAAKVSQRRVGQDLDHASDRAKMILDFVAKMLSAASGSKQATSQQNAALMDQLFTMAQQEASDSAGTAAFDVTLPPTEEASKIVPTDEDRAPQQQPQQPQVPLG